MKKVIIIAIFLFGYQILAGQDLIDNWMIEGETVVTDNINQSTGNAEYCPSTSSYWTQSNRSVFLPIYGSKKFKVKINFIVIQRESANRGNFINDEIYNEIIDGTIGLLNYHYDNLVNVPQES